MIKMETKKLLIAWYVILVIAAGIASAVLITAIFEHKSIAYSVFPAESGAPGAVPQTTTLKTIASEAAQQPATQEAGNFRVVHRSSGDFGSDGSAAGSSESDDGAESDSTTAPESEPGAPLDDACLEKYNLSPHTVIFYYASEPHSNAMKPIVSELESEYSFYWTSSLWDADFNSCFGTSGTTPVFVCSGTGEKLTGEAPKSLLESFAGECE